MTSDRVQGWARVRLATTSFVGCPPVSHSSPPLTQTRSSRPLSLPVMDSLECLTADHFDLDTFSQILEMDDSEEDRDFSRGIVYGYFEQAENTLESMQTGL